MSGFTIVVILILVMLAALSIYLLAVDEAELTREPGEVEQNDEAPDDEAHDDDADDLTTHSDGG